MSYSDEAAELGGRADGEIAAATTAATLAASQLVIAQSEVNRITTERNDLATQLATATTLCDIQEQTIETQESANAVLVATVARRDARIARLLAKIAALQPGVASPF